jgi:hypothetical protein
MHAMAKGGKLQIVIELSASLTRCLLSSADRKDQPNRDYLDLFITEAIPFGDVIFI